MKFVHSLAHRMDSAILLSKFRGSLLGVLIGDCCGAPFEGEILEASDKTTLRKYFDKLEGPMFKAPVKKFTDDTAMTKCIIKCLIEHKDLPAKQLASSFMKDYFREPSRGYGSAVVDIFQKWRQTKLEDPLTPAKEQFGRTGSYGNGAAMRIAPVGLFCHNKTNQLIELARKSAEVTHTHHLGIRGAVLQAIAVNLCTLQLPESFNKDDFIKEILMKMEAIENDDEGLGLQIDTSYQKQINQIKRLLEPDKNPTEDEVLNSLGHSVTALYSVPTAIFCFLRAQNQIDGIKANNVFRRTLEYAISLGGDTDTIASMAGSLTGALYGDEIIPPSLIKHCEGSDEIIQLAKDLYEASL